MRRALPLAVTLLAALALLAPAHALPTTSQQAGTSTERDAVAQTTSERQTAQVRIRLRAAIRNLPLGRERPAGYDRSRFGDWIDANGDCQDTRDEVLRAESRVRVARGCDVVRGRWHSYYDDRTWTRSSDVDIDHMVPLSESWKSGARGWNAPTRRRFANDLGDGRSLVAVTDNVNQSKGDSDPASWLPTHRRCTYVAQYTAVKVRWSLRVDRAEKRALRRVASNCSNPVLRVRKARIGRSGGDGGHDPRFDTCADAQARGYGPYRRGRDREYWWYTDGDSDGVVCE